VTSLEELKKENKSLKNELANFKISKSKNLVDGLIAKAKKLKMLQLLFQRLKAI